MLTLGPLMGQDVVRETSVSLIPMREHFAGRELIPFGTNNKFLVSRPSDASLPRVTKDLIYDPLVVKPQGEKVYRSMFNPVPPVYVYVPWWKRALRTLSGPFVRK